tara:strand:+ start:98 stop:343 length:246 start_codon:yes stop_codon:yes gene_type:complete
MEKIDIEAIKAVLSTHKDTLGKEGVKAIDSLVCGYSEQKEAITCLLEYIDALPDDIVLPAMPGVDRDWVENVQNGYVQADA